MFKHFSFFLFVLFLLPDEMVAQQTLPHITVKNNNGNIIVSWRNEYPLEVKNINIQRSFDSLKNFTTIGAVLNPQNIENGFVDMNPPYNKMYYRVFISFNAGEYMFSESTRPIKEVLPPLPIITQPVVFEPEIIPDPKTQTKVDSIYKTEPVIEIKKSEIITTISKDKIGPDPISLELITKKQVGETKPKPVVPTVEKIKTPVEIVPKEEVITYPSRRIFTTKDNNIIINLPKADKAKYLIKFFNDKEQPLFELDKVKEEFLIIEKVNFLKTGWFYFEIYENGKLIEKNKFFIAKDGKLINH